MILNNAPKNDAIMSNVGQIGEFRIKNSAKAFNILSSGLYANKIRAIIRELSCNAVDSHVDAGKGTVPFDLHLPNSLEPWFAIRDYGTGLTNAQVTNIYTTYFESTKTGSNDFIGALGLGSKSPFSYTDNFTVTAIKDGVKGIYTAFINEQGVPSTALMMEEKTDEPNGVEVKFAVDDRYDFSTFASEAQVVYKHFKLRPVVSGNANFKFVDPKYAEKDIIPGVHYTTGDDRRGESVAIMGNIEYPIDIPRADKTLGKLRDLLSCSLVMEFNIGELDFQASREGLSYIPDTINAIKKKLEALTAQLAIHLAKEADKIPNMWDRAMYLASRHQDTLWSSAVDKYVADTKFPLAQPKVQGQHSYYHHQFLKTFDLKTTDLESKYNITIRAFTKQRHSNTCSSISPHTEHDRTPGVATPTVYMQWQFEVNKSAFFVVVDTKLGAYERAKHHWRQKKMTGYSEVVYVLQAHDRTKPMLTDDFFKELMNPPADLILKASDLAEKPRKDGLGKNITIMKLEDRSRGHWNRNEYAVWTAAGKAADFDATKKYYYLPLSGFKSLGITEDVKHLRELLRMSGVHTGDIYGVRKGDIEFIKTQKNWILLDTFVTGKLSNIDPKLIKSLVKHAIDFKDQLKYNIVSLIDADSPYAKLHAEFHGVPDADNNQMSGLKSLCEIYKITMTTDIEGEIKKHQKKVKAIGTRYPLLQHLSNYGVDKHHVAEYVRAIDLVDAANKQKQVP